MSLVPEDKHTCVVQKTTLAPLDHNDHASAFWNFVDWCRRTIGLKPFALARRYAEAPVSIQEAQATATDLKARGDFELAMAAVYKAKLDAEGQYAVNMAHAEQTRIGTQLLQQQLTDAQNQSMREAIANLSEVIEKIRMHGGDVGFETVNKATKGLFFTDEKGHVHMNVEFSSTEGGKHEDP